DSTRTTTLLGAISGFFEKSTVYDAQGRKWQGKGVESRYKRTWWTVLLSNTFYNPWIKVTVTWREPKPFSLDELKSAYSQAVDNDDDILTQFVDADELKRRISEARAFDELVQVYKWMETDHTYEENA